MKKEVFIERAIAVHGDKFDYSLLPDEFHTDEDKVEIICKLHGSFFQRPSNHIHLKQLCPVCGDLKALETKRLKHSKEFLEQALKRFGNKFDYSQVEYKTTSDLVKIVCPLHGLFEQRPADHVRGKAGCFQCSLLIKRDVLADTPEQFIAKAVDVHGELYDYSKLNYTNVKTNLIIICSKHGEFEQTPASHLRGSGCPKCGDARGGRWSLKALDKNLEYFKSTKCFLYLMEINTPEFSCFKVGISETPKYRKAAINKELVSGKVEVINLSESNVYDCLKYELDIKKNLKDYRFIPPIKFAGHTECYTYSEDTKTKLLEWFK